MDGDEISFVFAHTLSPDSPPNPSLVGFTRTGIKRGESKVVSIDLGKEAFTLVNEKGERYTKAGLWTLSIGGRKPKKGKNREINIKVE